MSGLFARFAGRSWRTILATLALVLLAAACSSSSTSSAPPAAAGGSSSAAQVAPINIALAATGGPFAPIFIGQSEGYFAKEGVTVNFTTNAASTGAALLTSGRVDLFMVGPGPVFSLNSQGKNAQIIYNTYSGGGGAVILPAASTVKSIMDLSGKRIGTLSVGGSSYGLARIYSQYVVDHGGKPFAIVPFGTQGTVVNALTSGQVDAAIDSKSWFVTVLSDGKAKMLIDPSKGQNAMFQVPQGVSDGAIFGLADDMSSKKDSVVRFLKGVNDAMKFIKSHSAAQIAASLMKLPAFNDQTIAQITADVSTNLPFLGVDNGIINGDDWAGQIGVYAQWGIKGIDVSTNQFPYDKIVNMSYLNQALAQTQS
jgi:NitT/TauT family transport system substrate-binding protein